MAKYKISIDKATCTGCAACTATCPDGFEMVDDSEGMPKSSPKKAELDELGCAMEAAQVCPVGAIHILDVKANKKMI